MITKYLFAPMTKQELGYIHRYYSHLLYIIHTYHP